MFQTVIENAMPEEKRASILEILSLFFGEYFAADTKLIDDDPDVVAQYIDSIKCKKTIAVLLKHFHEHQSVWYGDLLVSCMDSKSWRYSVKKYR